MRGRRAIAGPFFVSALRGPESRLKWTRLIQRGLFMTRLLVAVSAIAVLVAGPVAAQPVDRLAINGIIDQGLNHSEVMQTAAYLTDRIGGRMTNSPQMREAEAWTQQRFRDWGLSNVRAEGFEFGRGWSIVRSSARMTAPRVLDLRVIPIAWTPSTDGVIRGEVVVAPITSAGQFEPWRGKLQGKIVMLSRPDTGSEPTEPAFRRWTDAELANPNTFVQPRNDPDAAERAARTGRADFALRLDAYNILADIPGTSRSGEYVMAGAHLDSWVASDGAVDNAAGSAVVMEAARILKALGVRPKRTIRFALWSGEEQGILGSLAYVDRHLATRAPMEDPAMASLPNGQTWRARWPIQPRPGYRNLVAYFNLDNGSGRIRGINAEGNVAAVPVFEQWLAPFASMGASTVSLRNSGGTDHVYMQSVGVPGYQFIQDPLDYGSRLHHTSIDSYDHLRAEDLRQAAVILASFLLNAANADEPLPRMPLPTRPTASDPFAWPGGD